MYGQAAPAGADLDQAVAGLELEFVADAVEFAFGGALEGTYDKLVAVEMIEAVGWRNFDRFFARVSELLEPDGLALLQAILIDDRAYDVEKTGRSFITKFIFPGGALPSMEEMARCVRRRTDLQWLDVEDLTADYVLTLRHWRARFRAAASALERAGYDQRFQRLWELYLRYCEAGFMERRITDVQALFAKPLYRPAESRVNILRLTASSSTAGPREASLASASRPPGPTT
jgi:cyclopropane-fatty-acyl-phospholipid synthase